MKPDRGKFINWHKVEIPNQTDNLGYYYMGTFFGHPRFDGMYGNTSMVVKETKNEDGTITCETLNSIYTLV